MQLSNINGFPLVEKLPLIVGKPQKVVTLCITCRRKRVTSLEYILNSSNNTCKKCSHMDAKEVTAHSDVLRHKIYTAWHNMKSRCYNPKNNRYYCYGQLGVYVCQEWLNNFEAFYLWSISNGCKFGLTLDKDKIYYETNLSGVKYYSPSRCSWITMQEQSKYANRP